MRSLTYIAALLLSYLFPIVAVAIENCGLSVSTNSPQRIVTLNQHSTELLLQLGVGHRMVGTAYPDDAIWEPLADDFRKIPQLSVFYPTLEQMLFSEVDFVVGGFNSAFSTQGVGDRQWWHDRGVSTYLLPSNCAPKDNMETVWRSITELGQLLNVQDAATQEIDRQKKLLSQRLPLNTDVNILVWSHDENTPYVAGGIGIVDEMIRLAGAGNTADDVPRPWGHMTWEAILVARPDLSVLVDADWAPASDKQAFIQSHPVLSKHLGSIPTLTMPFSETIAGIRTARGVLRINQALAEQGGHS